MGTISLSKDNASADINVTTLSAGAGWKTGKTKVKKWGGVKIGGGKQKEIDLDLTCVAEDQDTDPVAVCYYGNTDTWDEGSLVHSGDNQDGIGSGDDETINAFLTELPEYVSRLTFLVTAFKDGAKLSDVETAHLKIYDGPNGNELIHIPLKLNVSGNAVAIADATRNADGSWTVRKLNEARTISTDRDGMMNFAASLRR